MPRNKASKDPSSVRHKIVIRSETEVVALRNSQKPQGLTWGTE